MDARMVGGFVWFWPSRSKRYAVSSSRAERRVLQTVGQFVLILRELDQVLVVHREGQPAAVVDGHMGAWAEPKERPAAFCKRAPGDHAAHLWVVEQLFDVGFLVWVDAGPRKRGQQIIAPPVGIPKETENSVPKLVPPRLKPRAVREPERILVVESVVQDAQHIKIVFSDDVLGSHDLFKSLEILSAERGARGVWPRSRPAHNRGRAAVSSSPSR